MQDSENRVEVSGMFRKGRRLFATGYVTAVAMLLVVAQASGAGADSASCLAKASSFVAQLDELLSKEKNWLTPYVDLKERYFPLRDCDADALLGVVRRSKFLRSVSHNPRTNSYLIHFSSDAVLFGFGYLASEKKSYFSDPLWVNK